MATEILTDAQVEAEIERLRESPFVKLHKAEYRMRYKRRQYLYSLRTMERHGKELAAAGLTMALLEEMERAADES